MRHPFVPLVAVFTFVALCAGGQLIAQQTAGTSPDWARFRGPNGSGLSDAANVPTEFGKTNNMVWRLPLPPGHSSPIIHRDRIYLTAFRGETLVTYAIDRARGWVIWTREAPNVKTNIPDKRNNPASPSPSVDDSGIYVFFGDYGLVAYDLDGQDRWKMPLGPFDNIYGMGASPIIVGDLLLLACDQSNGSFLMAVDKQTGQERWKTPRPEAKSGHATPILWRTPSLPADGLQAADG
jgi:outer membrane protein assembly factor BamB